MKSFHVSAAVVLASFILGSVSRVQAGDEKAAGKQDPEVKIKSALAKLSEADRKLAEAQRYCASEPENRLGSMGAPVKIEIQGKPVFLCCAGCKDEALADPKVTLASVEKLKKVAAALAKLKDGDRALAERQRFCPVNEDSRLGSMGTPVKIDIKGKPVFLCCKGCTDDALADPESTLKKVEQLKNQKTAENRK